MLENNIPPYDEQKHKGIVRHLIIRTSKKTGNIMVVVVVNSNGIAYENKLIEKLLNQNENITLKSDLIDFINVIEDKLYVFGNYILNVLDFNSDKEIIEISINQ